MNDMVNILAAIAADDGGPWIESCGQTGTFTFVTVDADEIDDHSFIREYTESCDVDPTFDWEDLIGSHLLRQDGYGAITVLESHADRPTIIRALAHALVTL